MVSTRIKKASKKFKAKLINEEKLNHEHVKQLTPYKGAYKPIKFWCYHHKAPFWKTPTAIRMSKNICNICFQKRGVDGYNKGTKKFKKEVYKKCGDEYLVLEKYKKTHIPILMEHHSKKCLYYKIYHKFYKFKMAPDCFINQGQRCPVCMQHRHMGRPKAIITKRKSRNNTPMTFKQELYDLTNGRYIILSKYRHHEIPFLVEHHDKNCHYYCKHRRYYKFYITRDQITRIFSPSQGGTYICPIDSKIHQFVTRRKSQLEFEHEVFDQVGYEYRVLSKYHSEHEKVVFEHHNKKCLYYIRHHVYYRFLMTPDAFLGQGHRCPFNRSSSGERLVDRWLCQKGFMVGKDYFYAHICKYGSIYGSKRHQHFDFYLPNILNGIDIEFDGEQHFFEVNFNGHMTQKQLKQNLKRNIFRDKMKAEYCKKYGIKQIHIKNMNDYQGKRLKRLVKRTLNKELLPLIKAHVRSHQESLF